MTEVRSFWLDGTCYPCVRPGRTSKYLPHTVLYITMESMNWYSCVSLLSLSLWSIYDARMQLQYFSGYLAMGFCAPYMVADVNISVF